MLTCTQKNKIDDIIHQALQHLTILNILTWLHTV